MEAPARQAYRQQHALPVLQAFKAWLIEQRQTTVNNSKTAQAMDHTLKRWDALVRYVDDGRYPIGRVGMWRGGAQFGQSARASHSQPCVTPSSIAPFPHPAHRTGHADFPHPALFQTAANLRSCAVGGSA
jgi:hypothetical protein